MLFQAVDPGRFALRDRALHARAAQQPAWDAGVGDLAAGDCCLRDVARDDTHRAVELGAAHAVVFRRIDGSADRRTAGEKKQCNHKSRW